MNAWNITSNWKNEKYLGMLKKNITPSEQIHKQMGTSPEKKIGCAYTWPSTLPDWYWYIEEENKVALNTITLTLFNDRGRLGS